MTFHDSDEPSFATWPGPDFRNEVLDRRHVRPGESGSRIYAACRILILGHVVATRTPVTIPPCSSPATHLIASRLADTRQVLSLVPRVRELSGHCNEHMASASEDLHGSVISHSSRVFRSTKSWERS